MQSAISEFNLSQNVEKELFCSICLNLLTEPQTTECGHKFCAECIELWIKRDTPVAKCPVCRKQMKQAHLTPNYDAQQRTNEIVISCKGCNSSMAYKNWPQHKTSCSSLAKTTRLQHLNQVATSIDDDQNSSSIIDCKCGTIKVSETNKMLTTIGGPIQVGGYTFQVSCFAEHKAGVDYNDHYKQCRNITFGVRLIAGDNDDNLEWPFEGKLSIRWQPNERSTLFDFSKATTEQKKKPNHDQTNESVDYVPGWGLDKGEIVNLTICLVS